MADLQTLKAAIDELSSDDLNEIYNHIVQHRQPNYWLVPSENLAQILAIMRPIQETAAAAMTEAEINDIIDQALGSERSVDLL